MNFYEDLVEHMLNAIAIYGSHENHTLIDPDEVELLSLLAKAAATAHQKVRIETLTRRNHELEASTAELRSLVRERMIPEPEPQAPK